MKILAISDVESKSLWEFYTPEKLQGVDLVLSCGDLDPRYLSFLATFTPAPVLYVHGNHDTKYKERPPEGCECIEDKIYRFRGVRILGLGGSMRYKYGPNQYTPQEMERRLRRMRWKLWRAGGVDILLTHSPALGHNDGSDLPHIGFQTFRTVIDTYHPRYFIHGHVHLNYGATLERVTQIGDTTVVNAYERCLFEYETGKTF